MFILGTPILVKAMQSLLKHSILLTKKDYFKIPLDRIFLKMRCYL